MDLVLSLVEKEDEKGGRPQKKISGMSLGVRVER
jgi:hypothetical protein